MPVVAVTGASGFLGSAVVRQLLAEGREVRALLEPGARTDNLDPFSKLDRVSVDVCDGPSLKRALAGCETLYHLAAIYKLWLDDPEVIYRVNVEGVTSTLLAAKAAKVKRVVHTSSIAAVGYRSEKQPSDETTPFNLWPVANDYILTKHLSERVALRFAEAGLPVVVVNPSFPFGPGDQTPTPTGNIVLQMLRGQMPGFTRGGFSAIDVDDCARGHLLAEEKGRVGERYILTNHNITYKDFFALVTRTAGIRKRYAKIPGAVAALTGLGLELYADRFSHTEPRLTYKAALYSQRKIFFDNRKARTELGLPSRPLEESIARSIQFFREQGYLDS